jgi:hypothetical protein
MLLMYSAFNFDSLEEGERRHKRDRKNKNYLQLTGNLQFLVSVANYQFRSQLDETSSIATYLDFFPSSRHDSQSDVVVVVVFWKHVFFYVLNDK